MTQPSDNELKDNNLSSLNLPRCVINVLILPRYESLQVTIARCDREVLNGR